MSKVIHSMIAYSNLFHNQANHRRPSEFPNPERLKAIAVTMESIGFKNIDPLLVQPGEECGMDKGTFCVRGGAVRLAAAGTLDSSKLADLHLPCLINSGLSESDWIKLETLDNEKFEVSRWGVARQLNRLDKLGKELSNKQICQSFGFEPSEATAIRSLAEVLNHSVISAAVDAGKIEPQAYLEKLSDYHKTNKDLPVKDRVPLLKFWDELGSVLSQAEGKVTKSVFRAFKFYVMPSKEEKAIADAKAAADKAAADAKAAADKAAADAKAAADKAAADAAELEKTHAAQDEGARQLQAIADKAAADAKAAADKAAADAKAAADKPTDKAAADAKAAADKAAADAKAAADKAAADAKAAADKATADRKAAADKHAQDPLRNAPEMFRARTTILCNKLVNFATSKASETARLQMILTAVNRFLGDENLLDVK